MSAFANLKKKSGSSSFNQLQDKLKNEGKTTYEKDSRYWVFEVDKAGNGFATIRFLDAPMGTDGNVEEFPYVSMFEYAFKYKPTGRWYINLSRKTLGPDEKDPVDEAWAELWNQGRKEEAKQFSRSTRYVSNILVINDPKNPENNGKVFLYKYGPRIFQKIQGAISPEFEDEKPMNPFDLWNGANFKLKARMLDGQRSYDKSEFGSPSRIAETDEEIESIWSKSYSLLAEIAPEKFQSYEKLKARFESVIGQVGKATNSPTSPKKADDGDDSPPWEEAGEAPSAKPKAADKETTDPDLEAYMKLLAD